LKRKHVLFRLDAEDVFQGFDKSHQLDGIVVSDVVYPVRREACSGVRPLAAPGGIRCRYPVHYPDDTLDYVIDICKISPHHAVIIDIYRSFVENSVGEKEEGHVGPSPGTVYGEEPQAGARDFIKGRVGVRHEFVSLLRGGVQTYRVIYVLMDRERHRGVRAVDGTGRGKYEMRHVRVTASFENVDKAVEIAVHVRVGVLEAVTHTRLCGQVNNAVEYVTGEKFFRSIPVVKVEADKGEFFAGSENIEAVLFQPYVIVAVEVVDADDMVTVVQETPAQVETDETRGTGNENAILDFGF